MPSAPSTTEIHTQHFWCMTSLIKTFIKVIELTEFQDEWLDNCFDYQVQNWTKELRWILGDEIIYIYGQHTGHHREQD